MVTSGWAQTVDPRLVGTRRLMTEIPGTPPCYLPTKQSEEGHTPCRPPFRFCLQKLYPETHQGFQSFKHKPPILLAWKWKLLSCVCSLEPQELYSPWNPCRVLQETLLCFRLQCFGFFGLTMHWAHELGLTTGGPQRAADLGASWITWMGLCYTYSSAS